ncbi:MAG: hypothetical protein LBT44_01120, partial [Clostridiales bacterium]|nr:hypothetical protein [Clostridiales bacterium]
MYAVLGSKLLNVSTSSAYAGGICGASSGVSISNCYNTGVVSVSASAASSYAASASVGGICASGSSSISNCYNLGDVSASASYSSSPSAYAGGICGYGFNGKSGDVLGSISNCVVLSNSINAENADSPSRIRSYLIGNINDEATKTNNLALVGISGNATDHADRRITLEEAKSQTTYEALGWDFDTIWEMAPGYMYPQLKGLPATEPITSTPTPPQGVPLSGKIKSYNPK